MDSASIFAIFALGVVTGTVVTGSYAIYVRVHSYKVRFGLQESTWQVFLGIMQGELTEKIPSVINRDEP